MESFRTTGTCSRQILFDVDENNILTDVKFLGGCPGGLQALARLTKGKPITDIISICQGIKCKNDTSCPDQFAKALSLYLKAKEQQEQERLLSQTITVDISVINLNIKKEENHNKKEL